MILPLHNDVMVCVGREVLLWHTSAALVAKMATLPALAVAMCCSQSAAQRVLVGQSDGSVRLLGPQGRHFPRAPQGVRCVEATKNMTQDDL